VRTVAAEIEALREEAHSPVLLLGFSIGGGLCVVAAERARPDGLLLLAPFWWKESGMGRVVISVVRLFLPTIIHPLRYMEWIPGRLNTSEQFMAPGLDLMGAKMQNTPMPLAFLEQFRRLGRKVWQAAPNLDLPVLVIQGKADILSRPRLTRLLARRLGGKVELVEVEGGHTLVEQSHVSFGQICAMVTSFAKQISGMN
jgi:pimeloyl-ACP methyl ester carboxylesterase